MEVKNHINNTFATAKRWPRPLNGGGRWIEVSNTIVYWQINWDFGKWPLNRGWPLNRWALKRGRTVICLPTEHQEVHKNSFRDVCAFQDRIRIWKCWSLWRRENWSTRRKTSRSRVENQQQTESNPGQIDGGRAHSPLRHPCYFSFPFTGWDKLVWSDVWVSIALHCSSNVKARGPKHVEARKSLVRLNLQFLNLW